jgi:hypothetical protein
MKTSPITFRFSCDTVTLVTQYLRYSRRGFVTPRLSRVLSAIERELDRRASHAMKTAI